MNFRTNKLRLFLRSLHRDLGYFVVGMIIVYTISGILLNHRSNNNFAVKTTTIEKSLSPYLTSNEFSKIWNEKMPEYPLNTVFCKNEEYTFFVNGGKGIYEIKTGEVTFELYNNRPIIEFFNKLHYNQKKGWTIFADFFALSLILLTISGLIIVKGKKGFLRRGVYFTMLGIVAILIYVWI